MGVPKLLERSGIDPRLTDSNLGLQRALLELTRADACARSEQGDPWEFAVEMDCLLAAGLSTSDLRWLVKKGFVEHAYEITRRGDTARRFKSGCNVSFEGRTCFLLTKSGLVLAAAHGLRLPAVDGARERGFAISADTSSADTSSADTSSADTSAEPETGTAAFPMPNPPTPDPSPRGVPSWDPERRLLCWNGQIVKQFKVPSPTQESILAAFEEEGWPAAIDDPLPPQPEQDSKRRLRNTIQHLNANQKVPLVFFRGDGSGQRILWEPAKSSAGGSVAHGRLSIHAA